MTQAQAWKSTYTLLLTLWVADSPREGGQA